MTDDARILFVEDDPNDAELELRELEAAGMAVTPQRIETLTEFPAAVRDFKPQLIVCDYSLPGANGMDFLQLARELCADVPFVFVSGTLGEDRAVEALRGGATDYVLKDQLGSFAVRVRRALREADERRERQTLEERLRQAQKVEVIGRLAGGVAHDFNNLLMIIGGHAERTLDRLPEGDPRRDGLDKILNATRRGADLTRQLLAFARRQILAPTVMDLNAVVAGTHTMLHRLIGEDVDFATSLAPDLWKVKADRGQIEQVLMNLAINARDAMPTGGKLTIETRNVELDATYARTHISVQPGSYAMFAVSDTGTGMTDEVLAHLFEPFFTTKGPSHGTGLGLATVYGIVKQSGGNIWVYTEVGIGTTFKIYLPKVDEPLAVEAAAPARRSLRGTETILVVEDEDEVRALTRLVLEGSGYTVIEAADGVQALDIVRRGAFPIDLLLTDLVMPNMSGPELAGEVIALRPATKVLYLSGYPANALAHRALLNPAFPFLEKPVSARTLSAKVREVLDKSDQLAL